MSELPGPTVIKSLDELSYLYEPNRILIGDGLRTSETSGVFLFKVPENLCDGDSHFDGLIIKERDGIYFVADSALSVGHLKHRQLTQGHMSYGAFTRAWANESEEEYGPLEPVSFTAIEFGEMAPPNSKNRIVFENSSGLRTDGAIVTEEGRSIIQIKDLLLAPVASKNSNYFARHNLLETTAQAAALIMSWSEGEIGYYRGVGITELYDPDKPIQPGEELEISVQNFLQQKKAHTLSLALVFRDRKLIAQLSDIHLQKVRRDFMETGLKRLAGTRKANNL